MRIFKYFCKTIESKPNPKSDLEIMMDRITKSIIDEPEKWTIFSNFSLSRGNIELRVHRFSCGDVSIIINGIKMPKHDGLVQAFVEFEKNAMLELVNKNLGDK